MKIFLFILVFSWMFTTSESFASNFYKVREGDRIQNVFNAYYQSAYSGTEISTIEVDIKYFVINIKKANPNIHDWRNLKPGTTIVVPEFESKKKKFALGIFYTASQGNFSEKLLNTSAVIKSTQVSPITLGIMGQLQFENPRHLIPASFYISKLNPSTIDGVVTSEGNSLSIPMEVGGNIYYQYSMASKPLAPYFGLDYEKISTFNAAGLEMGELLTDRQNSLIYATAGLGYNFTFKTFRLHLKTSFSKTISSSSTSSNPADRFTGIRGMLYLNIKRDSPFLFHIFLKHHELSGPTKLTINRIGLGFGYFFY